MQFYAGVVLVTCVEVIVRVCGGHCVSKQHTACSPVCRTKMAAKKKKSAKKKSAKGQMHSPTHPQNTNKHKHSPQCMHQTSNIYYTQS